MHKTAITASPATAAVRRSRLYQYRCGGLGRNISIPQISDLKGVYEWPAQEPHKKILGIFLKHG